MKIKVWADGFFITFTDVKHFSTDGGALVITMHDGSIRAWGPGFWKSFTKDAD